MNKREIYTHDRYIKYLLIGGTIGKITRSGELRYFYGEVPQDNYEYYDKNNTIELFDVLLRTTNYFFSINQTLIGKRIYVSDDGCWLAPWYLEGTERLYKDELISFYVVDEYDVVKKPSNDKLRKDLNFYDYTQLIFDRERELKSILTDQI